MQLKQGTYHISCVNIVTRSSNSEHKQYYLSENLDSLPSGFFPKERTGIGATTLEIKSRRNSIIVVPLRELAYQKVINYEKVNGEYKLCYCGGKYKEFNQGFTQNIIKAYLNNEAIPYKKFIVVADSLPKLLDILKCELEVISDNTAVIGNIDTEYKNLHNRALKDYFIAFDEIDSYQNDAGFRPNLAKAFDYYWDFQKPSKNPEYKLDAEGNRLKNENGAYILNDDGKRCMLSATAKQENFSDPRIKEEQTNSIEFDDETNRGIIELYPTNDPVTRAKQLIVDFWIQQKDNNKQEKLLVALNKITSIMDVLLALSSNEETREILKECGVMCARKEEDDDDNKKDDKKLLNSDYKEQDEGVNVNSSTQYKGKTASEEKLIRMEENLRKAGLNVSLNCEIEDCNLNKRIVFMTCSYYVGIDIKDQFHLLQVAQTKYAYTLFSVERLIQIQGRCRHENGVLSNKLVYDSYIPRKKSQVFPNEPFPHNYKDYQKMLSNALVQAAKWVANNLTTTSMPPDVKSVLQHYWNLYENTAHYINIQKTRTSIDGSSMITLVRYNKDNIPVPNYFNIDNIVNQATLINYLYNRNKPNELKEMLEKNGYEPRKQRFVRFEDSDSITDNKITTEISKEVDTEHEKLIIDAHFENESSILKSLALRDLKKNLDFTNDDKFQEYTLSILSKIIPKEDLKAKIAQDEYKREQGSRQWKDNTKKLLYGTIFWALNDKDPDKEAVITRFPIGHAFSSNELKARIREIENDMHLMGHFKKSDGQAIFFNTRKTTITNSKTHKYESKYIIIDYDPCQWKCKPRVDTISEIIGDNHTFHDILKHGIGDEQGRILIPPYLNK